MNNVSWSVLAAFVIIWRFGLSYCIVIITSVIAFFIGGLTYLYIHEDNNANSYYEKIRNYKYYHEYPKKLSELMKKHKKKLVLDDRLTGSRIIDEELQIILYYTFRDFVFPWYEQISDDPEFPYQLKETVHQMIIAISERIKVVDWIPYFATKLVDDVASHLRLYKQARSKVKLSKATNLLSIFFDLELTMEKNTICRDSICLDSKEEKHYLQSVSEGILFQIMPQAEFKCSPIRYLAREMLTEIVLYPLVTMISDPDFINQTIISLCSDFPISNDTFLTILKTTNNVEELYSTNISVKREISNLRSKDADNDHNSTLKNQLSSLLFVEKIIEMKLSTLQEGSDRDSTGVPCTTDYKNVLSNQKLISLPLDFIIKNDIALGHFIDYMTSINSQSYVFAYLNMEGWKTSTNRELNKTKLQIDEEEENIIFSQLKTAAHLLYDQYLSEKSTLSLVIDGQLVKSVYIRINSEIPNSAWFDDIIVHVYRRLQTDENFLPSFYKSNLYVKLLVDLDILKEPYMKDAEDDEDISTSDEFSSSSTPSSTENSPKRNPLYLSEPPGNNKSTMNSAIGFTLNATIIETGLVQENGKSYGVYAIEVTKLSNTGQSQSWHVYRRYSEFHELHKQLKEKYPDVAQIPFPAKKTFNNIERNVREKRMKMLNNYMRILLQWSAIRLHPSVQNDLLSFLGVEYDKNINSGQFSKTFDNLVINPLKLVGNAVMTMPDNFINTVDGMMEGLGRVFTKSSMRPEFEEGMMKVSSEINDESDNIPLRIMLLLLTEVFDLKTRNQWLRRRIITLLRQIMNIMFGDLVNKRIVDFVTVITSPHRVALCLAHLKNSIWPNGIRKRVDSSIRDHDIRTQTRVAAKCALLASFSDDLKHILGSETSRTGLMLLFSMFQNEVLNKRLLYVIFEGFLVTLYPNLNKLFIKFHSNSPRVVLQSKMKHK